LKERQTDKGDAVYRATVHLSQSSLCRVKAFTDEHVKQYGEKPSLSFALNKLIEQVDH